MNEEIDWLDVWITGMSCVGGFVVFALFVALAGALAL